MANQRQSLILSTVDNPCFSKWQAPERFAQLLLNGQQVCRVLPNSTLSRGQLLDQLFPGLSLRAEYYMPCEIFMYSTFQLAKEAGSLAPHFCRSTFWIALPESLAAKLLSTATLRAQDMRWAMGILQLGLCPRSAILLSTFSHHLAIRHGQAIPFGSQKVYVIGIRLPRDFLTSLLSSEKMQVWNRQYLDHFVKLEESTVLQLPRESLMNLGVYFSHLNFNWLAEKLEHTLNSPRGQLVRTGHLILYQGHLRTLHQEENQVPRELLEPLFRTRF